jgi:hypothetical protein
LPFTKGDLHPLPNLVFHVVLLVELYAWGSEGDVSG